MNGSLSSAVRIVAVLLLGIAGTVVFGRFLDGFYAIRTWLFFRLLTIYTWDLLLTVSCASFGHLVVTKLLRLGELPGLEKLALSLPVGLVGFVLAMYAGGFLALYGPVFALALPIAMLVAGLPAGLRALAGRAPVLGQLRGMALLITVWGTLCLGLMYLELISPDALNYDATWTHVVIAQDYARERRIVPFLADWNKNVPHLASLVYTWAFLVPDGPIADPFRWMIVLHTEFTIFVWTLVGVSAAAARLSGNRVKGAWVAYFLFPSILVYDGNLGGSSDHLLALFAAPLLLAAMHTAKRFDVGPSALLGILVAGALATKLQAVCMIVPIAMWLLIRFGQLSFARIRARPDSLDGWHLLRGVGAAVGCSVVFASPHLIKNWFYFHNPVYPLAQHIFTHGTLSIPGGAQLFDNMFVDWRWHPPKEMRDRLWQAARLVFMFSFEPHYSFIGNLPSFGSLFTLLVPVVPFLPNARRLSVGALVGLGALFVWAFTYWVDRNLQTFLPILVAVTAATIAGAWQLGVPAQVGVVSLVGLQLVWGADLMFSGSDRLEAGVALIKSGYNGNAKRRFAEYRRAYREVGQILPPDALAVLHNHHVSLGINRRILLDWMGMQGLIDYRAFKTPRQVYNRFAALGVTHLLVLPGSRTAPSKQEEVLFDTFVASYAGQPTMVHGFAVYRLPSEPPPEENEFRVLMMGIGGYADGVYLIGRLGVCEEMPPELQNYAPPDVPLSSPANPTALLATVNAAVVASSVTLDSAASAMLQGAFRPVQAYSAFTVYARAAVHPEARP